MLCLRMTFYSGSQFHLQKTLPKFVWKNTRKTKAISLQRFGLLAEADVLRWTT